MVLARLQFGIYVEVGMYVCHEERERAMSQIDHQQEPRKEKRESHFQSSCSMKLEWLWRKREEKRDPDEKKKGGVWHTRMREETIGKAGCVRAL